MNNTIELTSLAVLNFNLIRESRNEDYQIKCNESGECNAGEFACNTISGLRRR